MKRLAAGLPHREHLLAQQAVNRIERSVAAMRLRIGPIAGLLQRRIAAEGIDAARRQNRRAARAKLVERTGNHRSAGTVGNHLQPGRRSRAAAGQVQFAALRVALKRVDDGVSQPFEHRPLQLRAGWLMPK